MNIDTLQRAWKLASEKHYGQKYGGPNKGEEIEYIEHIGSVLLEVKNAIQNDHTIDTKRASLGAVFHDILEDTDCAPEYIVTHYGQGVFEVVDALTKNESLASKKEMMQDSLDRIQKTYREAAIIKMADRICNLYHPPFYWTKARMMEYVTEAKIIHAHLSNYSDYLGERLMTKIEKYELEFIEDHTKDYLNWELVFTGAFLSDKMNEIISTLGLNYGQDNVKYRTRTIGVQITISLAECTLAVAGNEDGSNHYSLQFETDNFLKNSNRIVFLKNLKRLLNQHTKDLTLEYFFEHKRELTRDFQI